MSLRSSTVGFLGFFLTTTGLVTRFGSLRGFTGSVAVAVGSVAAGLVGGGVAATGSVVGFVSVTNGIVLVGFAATGSVMAGSVAAGVPTGGAPVPLAMRYGKAGFFTTTVFSDLPVSEDQTGEGQPVWTFGDAPIWSDATMMATYTASGETRQAAAGTLNVAVRDCAGSVVEGVSVTITPMPGKLAYQAIDGGRSMTLTATALPFGHAFALNAQAGVTQIVATKAGRTFLDTEVTVAADRNNTLAIVRAVD